MSIHVFTDIDDTLMTTARKLAAEHRVQVGAVGKNGAPLSYCSAQHVALFSMLQAMASEPPIAVTARSADALRRVQLPMNSQAVVDFGATVLDASGAVDPEWASVMARARDRALERVLLQCAAHVASRFELAHTETRMTPTGLAFINLRAGSQVPGVTMALEQALGEFGEAVTYHLTDRDVAILPAYVNKGCAAQYLVQKNQWANDVLLACGDSLSDMAFMQHAHFALTPNPSRLMAHLRATVKETGAIR